VFVGQPIGSSAIQSGGTFTCSVFNGGTFVEAHRARAPCRHVDPQLMRRVEPLRYEWSPFAAVLGPASVNPGTVQTLVFSH